MSTNPSFLTALLLFGPAMAFAQVTPNAAYFEIDGDYGSVLEYQAPIHGNYLPSLRITDGDGANRATTYAPKQGLRIGIDEPACTDWYHISSTTYMGAQAYRVQAIFPGRLVENPDGDEQPRRSEQMILNDWYTGTDSTRYFTLAFRFNTLGTLPPATGGFIAQWHHGGSGPPPVLLAWNYENGAYRLRGTVYKDSPTTPTIKASLFSTPASPDVWHRLLFRVDPGPGWGRAGCEHCPNNQGSVNAWMMNPKTGEWESLGEYEGQLGYHFLWDDGIRIGDRTGTQLSYQWKVGHYASESNWVSLDYDNVAYGKRWNNITKNKLIGYKKSVLNLKFDEGTATVANDSCWSWNGGTQGDATVDYNNDGLLYGNLSWSTDGVGFWRRSLQFNGGYVKVPLDTTDFDFGNYVTVSAWFKTTAAAPQPQGLVSIDEDDNAGKLFLARADDRLSFGVRHPDGTYSQVIYNHTPGLYADGQWHHLVGTFNRFTDDNRRVKLYIDGVRVLQRQGYDKPMLRGNGRLTVGKVGAAGAFLGHIDEVNVLNYTMTDAEVTGLMAESTRITRVWDGGSAGSGNWTADANWVGNIQPASGDILIFPSGASRLANTNTFSPETAFGGIIFQGDNYNIYGNAVTITNHITTEAGASGNAFRPRIRLGAASSVRALGSGSQLTLLGDIDLNGHDLALVCLSGQVVCGGVISGTGNLTKSGNGRAIFSGMSGNTYNGTTHVLDGILALSKYITLLPGNARLGRMAIPGNLFIGLDHSTLISDAVVCEAGNQISDNAEVIVRGTGELSLNGYSDTIRSLQLWGGDVHTEAGTLTVTANIHCERDSDGSTIRGHLNLGPEGTVFMIADKATLHVSASVSGAPMAELHKVGLGELRLSSVNDYPGATVVSAGTLLVNGRLNRSASVQVGPLATLGGTGEVGNIYFLGGGRLAPGQSPGILSATTVLLNSGTLDIELNGTNSNSECDRLNVAGDVTLGGELKITTQFSPVPGDTFVILNKASAGAISATFAGLPERALFAADGFVFQISYQGGDGNDIALTRVAGPPPAFRSLLHLSNGQMRLSGTGLPKASYIVEATDDLATPNWVKLGSTTQADPGGVFSFDDPNAMNHAKRFYRLMTQ